MRIHHMMRNLCFIIWVLLVNAPFFAAAEVRLPKLISDNMVLQRGRTVQIWGWGKPGEKVSVSIADQSSAVEADKDGKWLVRLGSLQAGGPHEMKVSGENTITIKNVLVGEVWVCSGQSNMAWGMSLFKDTQTDIAQADFPKIRWFNANSNQASEEPQKDIPPGYWAVCSPRSVPGFSATGYFFARELHRTLNVPVGIINCSAGGTIAEAWTDRESLSGSPELKPLVDKLDNELREYAKGAPSPANDPRGKFQTMPSGLFNGLIAPLLPYSVTGIIWYQGESNADNPNRYKTLFPLLIKGWRKAWRQEDMPFIFVQLPSYGATTPPWNKWAEIREAQCMALALPKTAMVVTIDNPDSGNLHPNNKRDVGARLALSARAVAYGENVVYSGPLFKGMSKEDGKLRIAFTHVGGGLEAKGGQPLKGFEIAGGDGKFLEANTEVDNGSVLVWKDGLAEPAAVRYAWDNNPVCSLFNKEGLPASPFRFETPQSQKTGISK